MNLVTLHRLRILPAALLTATALIYGHVTQACDGEIVATCSTWLFEPASGSDPDRLNSALERAGFFREGENEGESAESFDDALAALEAVEEEFHWRVEPGAVEGPPPTAIVPVHLG
ncbi:hypothetical protein ACFYUH_16400 [Streptomyces fimicarius]|uniref:hypothetical protein n=1 Tax=Streptomyces griseus TaxID=1911 RepID=UPI0036783252